VSYQQVSYPSPEHIWAVSAHGQGPGSRPGPWPAAACGWIVRSASAGSEAAHHFGPAWAALKAVNRTSRSRTADLQIACVAIANELPLLTANPKDFVGLEQLLEIVPVSVY
jgi:hypothetical protein